MAKLSFSKLNLSKNQEVKELEFNGQIIEVKQYLPIEKKEEMTHWVIQQIVESNETYMNEFAFRTYIDLAIVFNYTNLTFTDKQKEDLNKLYDLLAGSGFVKAVRGSVNCDELDAFELYVYENTKHYFEYRNSLYGIMDVMSRDYGSLATDAKNLQAELSNSSNLNVLKETLTKLG